MSDSIIFIRKLVVNAISQFALQPLLPVVATYDPTFGLEQLSGGRLVVTPQTLAPKLASRGASQRKQVKIDLAVQYKFKTTNQTEIDPYLILAESFSDEFLGFMFQVPIPDTSPVQMRDVGACLETAFPHGLWVSEHMGKFKVFTSVITLSITYAK